MRPSCALIGMAAAAMLAGCATSPASPPPPLLSAYDTASGYGYTDERLGPDLVRVVYQGLPRRLDADEPARAPQLELAANEAADIALWRAAQLAVAAGKPAFAVVDRRTDTEIVRRTGGWIVDPWWPDYCYPRFSRLRGCRDLPPSYLPPAAEGRARAALTVRFENRVTPGNTDAAATIRRLQLLYTPPARS